MLNFIVVFAAGIAATKTSQFAKSLKKDRIVQAARRADDDYFANNHVA